MYASAKFNFKNSLLNKQTRKLYKKKLTYQIKCIFETIDDAKPTHESNKTEHTIDEQPWNGE